jgi:Uma2 family endonuclease
MPTTAPRPERLTHEQYLALEASEDQRYEYLGGEVFAMAGGSERHALIAANTLGALIDATRDRPCRVYGSDMKVHICALDKFCYPDAMLACEDSRRSEQYVENPRLVVEVLSPQTEAYDRGLKFEHYRAISALRYYLLLDQNRVHAELFLRSAESAWVLNEARGMDGVLDLQTDDIRLALAELYRQVVFPRGPDFPGAVAAGETGSIA